MSHHSIGKVFGINANQEQITRICSLKEGQHVSRFLSHQGPHIINNSCLSQRKGGPGVLIRFMEMQENWLHVLLSHFKFKPGQLFSPVLYKRLHFLPHDIAG